MTIEEAIANNIGSVITGTVAILSACITTGVAVWISSVNHNRAVAEAKRKESIERLESLYTEFECWSNHLMKTYLIVTAEFKGYATREDTFKKLKENSIPKDYLVYINATLNLHNRDLLSLFNDVSEQQRILGEFLLKDERTGLFKSYMDEQRKFLDVCSKFKNGIVAEMNKLTK